MRIDRVTSESFAGVRDFNVEFKDGVNIVYGKNEAGKSTLVNLISRTLFQNARIDGRSDKSFRDSYFPTQRKGSAAAGDSIDGSVTISDGEDTYKLTKEWGADRAASSRRQTAPSADRTASTTACASCCNTARACTTSCCFRRSTTLTPRSKLS